MVEGFYGGGQLAIWFILSDDGQNADYFSISDKDLRISRATRAQPVPSMAQMHHVIDNTPAGTDIKQRNRAIVALIFLTGVRDGALLSLKLKHIDISEQRLDQDAREVRTKFAKTFSTWFFPVEGNAAAIVTEWVVHLREDLLFGDDDPLFPMTKVAVGDNGFEAAGIERKCWTTAQPVRTIFKEAFEAVGLNYFKPHSVRKTLARYGQQICRSPAQFKAWSQNLGHSDVMTTFSSYGEVPANEQAELIRNLGQKALNEHEEEMAAAFLDTIRTQKSVRKVLQTGRSQARPTSLLLGNDYGNQLSSLENI